MYRCAVGIICAILVIAEAYNGVYNTVQSGIPTQCLIKCGYYGRRFEWCYISYNYDWAYCSSSVQSTDMAYAKKSRTFDGTTCMNNCVKNNCVTAVGFQGQNVIRAYCESLETPAPIYNTTQTRGKKIQCLSRCGYFRQRFEWCFTTNTYEWDYCSSAVVQPTDMLYNKISQTFNGRECMNNCVNNYCVIGISVQGRQITLCRSTERVAPTYYTISSNGKRTQCLSRCGHFGHNAEWCFTSNSLHWDYCSSAVVQSTDMLYSKTSQTFDGSICMNNCVNKRCVAFVGFKGQQVKTSCRSTNKAADIYYTTQKRGKKSQCLSRCSYFGQKFEWCYTTNNRDWDYCSSTLVIQPPVSEMLYNKVSKAFDGSMCMNNCVNNSCITILGFTGKDPIREPCLSTNEVAPVYYTAHVRGKKTCLSRCAYFRQNFEWCFTSNDYDWDYCSSAVRTRESVVNGKQFSYNLIPCADYCKRSRDYKYRCKTIYGNIETCNRRGISYMKAKTVYGLDCVSTCWKHKGESYYWCNDVNRRKNYCAPPARPRLL